MKTKQQKQLEALVRAEKLMAKAKFVMEACPNVPAYMNCYENTRVRVNDMRGMLGLEKVES